MARALVKTPKRMVDDGRISAFGHFERPFTDNNILEARFLGLGRPGAALLNKWRLKDWQHIAVFGPDFLLTFVILNAHYLASSFCYFVDRRSGEMIEYHHDGLPYRAKLARELWDDHCSYKAGGYALELHNHLNENRHTAQIAIAGKAGKPDLTADLTLHADLTRYQPLEVILRLAPNRPAYSHKMAMPVSGLLRVGERDISIDADSCLALLDVHKAYYPYRMSWRWASCAGYDGDGRLIGLNLTHNVAPDDEENNENCLWAGRELSMLGAARFSFDEKNPLSPWRIETTDGRCRLDFLPAGERRGRINAGIVASDYHQPYGLFNGEVYDDNGQRHLIKDYFGVTEFHRARF